jgi:hypothetical protein
MISFLTSAGLPAQDIILKTAANDRKPMIFFIKKFEWKTPYFVSALYGATQPLYRSNIIPRI